MQGQNDKQNLLPVFSGVGPKGLTSNSSSSDSCVARGTLAWSSLEFILAEVSGGRDQEVGGRDQEPARR